MSERVWSTGGMLLFGAQPKYSMELSVPRCLLHISHGRAQGHNVNRKEAGC